jgi:hypothetical protein
MNLVDGSAFGVFDIHTRGEFARPWAKWGDEITRRYVAGFPGSRPMAAYILGQLQIPAWQHELPGLRRPLRPIAGLEVAIPDMGWHKLVAELEHLAAIGIVDDDEYDRAVERLARTDATYHGRYVSLADEQEAAARAAGIIDAPAAAAAGGPPA